jgi:hypothetical protein
MRNRATAACFALVIAASVTHPLAQTTDDEMTMMTLMGAGIEDVAGATALFALETVSCSPPRVSNSTYPAPQPRGSLA